ncbi:transglutaminase-like cysteine peptidase [Amphritea balenae]|nr:transglutaminase-like cysteine peptidase [Amphritea balenae]
MFTNAPIFLLLISFSVFVQSVEKTTTKSPEDAYLTSDSASLRLSQWRNLIRMKHRFRAETDIVAVVDDFINKAKYQPDEQRLNGQDYWAAPKEFVAAGRGDCEDFAIAKLFTLQAMGVPVKRLRLVFTLLKGEKTRHLVLLYSPEDGSEPWVLDNLTTNIRVVSQRTDLQPVFSFTPKKIWMMKGWQQTVELSRPLNLPKWTRITRNWQARLDEFTG